MKIYGKNMPSRGNNKAKGPEAEMSIFYIDHLKNLGSQKLSFKMILLIFPNS